MASRTVTHILVICAVLTSIFLVAPKFIHFIKGKVSDIERPMILVRVDSIDRMPKYPCEPGTEDYQYEGYVLCHRRYDFVAPARQLWPSPFSKPRIDQ